MSSTTKRLLIGAAVVGVVGAILAFALDGDTSVGALDLKALGWVLLGLAGALLIAAAISAVKPEDGKPVSEEALRTVTGLVAVVAGITAVGALSITTVELVGVGEEGNTEATVAITTSAFGIVSTVITAYLGIKATANASKESRVERNPPNVTEVETGGE
ncbi:MAG TPA: hypothetical protein VF125_02895 [Solirubrobacterales bacterium]